MMESDKSLWVLSLSKGDDLSKEAISVNQSWRIRYLDS